MKEEKLTFDEILEEVVKKEQIASREELSNKIININLDNYKEKSPRYLSMLMTLKSSFGELEGQLRPTINNIFKVQENLERLRLKVYTLIAGRRRSEATEEIVKYILSKKKIFTTRDDNKSEIWIYKDGVYLPQGRSYIKEISRTILKELYSIRLINEVISKIETDTYIDQEDFFSINNVEEIPVGNGILNLLTKQLTPFNPEKIFFNKLPVKYDPNAKCEKIDNFLKEVLSNEEDRLVFYEIGGFTLLKEYKFEKAFMFVGSGRNGKDKSLELIKRLLGINNTCSIPLQSIVPESFILSEFHNKMANLAGEINNHDLKDTSMFKALTGRSLLSAPRKFLSPITFINYAKFIFACNELPMVYDNSKGFWDRWVLLEFPYTFVTKKEYDLAEDKEKLKIRDEDIIEKITTPEEMSGLLNKFLEGLDRLLKNKEFSSTKGSEEIKQLWIRKSNSVMAFAMSNIEEDYKSFIPKKQFRSRYIKYCKEHKINPKSDVVIKRTLQDLFGVSEEKKDVYLSKYEWVWSGIKWKK